MSIALHNYGYTALSSVYGKISQILVTYPGDASEITADDIYERYGQLFEAFGDRVVFLVLANFEGNPKEFNQVQNIAKEEFAKALKRSHLYPSPHLIHLPAPLARGWKERGKNNYNHSEYVQDRFWLLRGAQGEGALLEPYRTLELGKGRGQEKNGMVAEQVASATGFLIRPSSVYFEGGNLLVGDDYALIGKETWLQNQELYGPELDQGTFTTKMKELLGIRYLVWIGEEGQPKLNIQVDQGRFNCQPFFHLDLFLTLGGKDSDGDELIFLGKIRPDQVDGCNEEEEAELVRLNGQLDEVEAELRKYGREIPGPRFEVWRLPIGGKMERGLDGKRRFTPYSYNNALVEWFHGVRRIFLPSYPGCEKNEQEIRETLVGLGFKVTFIRNAFDQYARQGASLNCITKVLQRSSY